MTNEELALKRKYRSLYYSLNNIKNSVVNVRNNINNLKTQATNTVNINREGIESNNFIKLYTYNDNIIDSINSALDSISNKM